VIGKRRLCRPRKGIKLIGCNRLLNNDYLSLLARLIVGGIFIYASLDKITQPAQFARIVYNYHIMPGEFVNFLAIVMPWLELICGISVILGVYRDGGLLILNFLIVVFVIAITINIFRGVDLECGCFTVSARARGNALSLLIRDIGLLVVSVYALLNKSSRFQIIK